MRNNPDSYEILFELGRLYYENYHDAARARNLWELGLRRWAEQETAGKKPDLFHLDQLAVNLARLEEKQGNLPRAIELLGLAKKASPHPEVLQQQIDELKQKLAAPLILSGPQGPLKKSQPSPGICPPDRPSHHRVLPGTLARDYSGILARNPRLCYQQS